VSGLESYRSKDWRAAREAFERALAVRADDGPSLTYLKRCKEFMVSPPPDDWDGVYVMTSK
jgi:adenylate cyclase